MSAWGRVGWDADGEVFVICDVDERLMRRVRLGNGAEEEFDPSLRKPLPWWFHTLTHRDATLVKV